MTKYLMRIFREISEKNRGFIVWINGRDKYNRALKKLLNDIKLKSDSL